MQDWLNQLKPLLSHGDAVVLVTVARVEGSAPRDAGTKMLITRSRSFGSIGGGHLEWRALEIGRRLLAEHPSHTGALRQLEKMSLGPSLGQCCGGVVTLAFERLGMADLGWVAALQKRDEAGLASQRRVWFAPPLGAPGAVEWQALDTPQAPDCRLLHDAASDRQEILLSEVIAPECFHVRVFGAGHVGAAVVKVLLTLRCTVHWVDQRDAQFAPLSSPKLVIDANDAPESAVDQAPPGSYFLVMTHSHALDQLLSERILRRGDSAFFGLIGSLSKRRQFEHRLLARGIEPEQLMHMVCPIGVAGIHDKSPETIAIAVAAQLLQQVAAAARAGAADAAEAADAAGGPGMGNA